MSPSENAKTFGHLLIEQEIGLHGPMPFSQFMDLALYHPRHGYYSQSTPQRGKEGDYFTSFQVSPVFSDILADVVIQMRATLDSDSFSLIEYGSGGGEFLERLCNSLAERNELKGLRIISIERSRAAREKIMKRLSRFPKCQVVSHLDEVEIVGGLEGCIFSNEFFDALPFHRLRFDGAAFQEIFVTLEGGSLMEIEGPVSSPRLLKNLAIPEFDFLLGQEIEVRPSVNQWFEEIGDSFFRGYVMTFDYGYPRASLYSPQRMKGTWLCYNKHESNQSPLTNIGRQDITAHIDFTQLVEEGRVVGLDPALFASQGLFLTHAGQSRIEKFLQEAPEQEKRQRIGAIQQLVHPSAMGEAFWVLLQTKAVSLPESLQAIPSRLRRLL
jgi:SAM-dependent MidA family methyltransferase